jgi:hypothetical protein
LVVGGPGGGAVDSWADCLAPLLGPALSPGVSVQKEVVGGVDGVTAANQFEAWAVPDGSTALLLPGRAAMAWLAGDPRARFDAARWVPALAASAPCIAIRRAGSPPLQPGARLRVAVSSPEGLELPALLAMDMLGVQIQPVMGLTRTAAVAGLMRQQVDVVCLSGRHVSETVLTLTAAGASPLFSLGLVDETGRRPRDPDFPEVPDVTELLGDRTVDEHLLAGWRATAAAAELEMALVLPQLTPAAMVALWRRACTQAVASATVQSVTSEEGLRALTSPAATATTAAVVADTSGLLALRSWLASRLDYRPA